MPEERVLVCVHGLAASPRWWRDVREELALLGPVELLDIPRALRPDGVADWLAGRLEGIGPPVDLVGHSLGALVAVRVAALRPELVERLVLIAPPGMRQRSAAGYGLALLFSLVRCRPGFLFTLAVDAVRAGPGNIVRGWLHVAAVHASPEPKLVRAPTLLVWGECDRLVPPGDARLWQEAMPHADLVVIPGARHVPMVEAPAELVAAIAGFRQKGVDEFRDSLRV